MSRLDQHISTVQRRLTLNTFLHALSMTLSLTAGAAVVAIAIDKLVGWRVPRPMWCIEGAALIAILAACVIAYRRRPNSITVAAAIDARLGLQERISTALFARKLNDPFATAAVKDAESVAGNVVLNLGERFPLSFPKLSYVALLLAGIACLLALFVSPMDLLGHEAAHKKTMAAQQVQEQSKKRLEDALATVNSVPPAIANDEKIKLARQDLMTQLAKPGTDPAQASRSAIKALQDVGSALEQQVKNNVQYAQAKADEKMWKQIGDQPITEPGPVNDVRKELAQGKFEQAVDDLSKVVNNFDKMDAAQQQKAAEQMKQLAQQLQQQANPSAQQQHQVQQQLQQMGLNQQQSQQAQQLMQQAASGDHQAQQQLQQMAKQAMSQMNNGQGPTAGQKQQMQQMMQQMQAQANNQAQAQQLAQAAQQMQQAMQQQAGQQQSAQQQQGKQQQQSQKQQAQNQQSGNQQGKQGQQSGQQHQQAMSGAMQQMQAQLQQMQAAAGDAQQIAAAQQAAQDGINGGNGTGNADGGDSPGQWPADSPPPGQNGKKGQGNGGGKGFGAKGIKREAPYTLKPEISPSPDDENGRLLATSYVKAGSIKGESRAQLRDVAAKANNDPTDEIDQDRISRQAQSVVRKYFSSMQEDASATTQP